MNQNIEVQLTNMTPTGQAIGRHEGRVIFVPYALPDELVKVQIVHERPTYAHGRLLEVLHPSLSRVQPRCTHFGSCGGCEWQHIAPQMQLIFKTQAVREQLKRIGKFDDVEVLDCIASPQQYGYRNHTQFITTPDGTLGYYRANSHHTVTVIECPILNPSLQSLLTQESKEANATATRLGERTKQDSSNELHLRCGEKTGEISIAMEHAYNNYEMLAGVDPLREIVCDTEYAISAGSFFQVNTGATELLVTEVLESLQLAGHERVLELYCGVGLFTLPISRSAKYVLGIEASASATANARDNLREHANASIVTDTVKHWISSNTAQPHPWDAIVMDPPRAGIDRESLLHIAQHHAPLIVYISCDPATLARDAQIICQRGYRFIRAQPLDMFPQTHHVETVAVFTLQVNVGTL